MDINAKSLIKVSQIIERDSKDTSYKFALLRATIDVINLYDQQIINFNDRVLIPTGLIIERWLWYYYPLIESKIFLPQRNSESELIVKGKNISFRKHFTKVIEEYSEFGHFEHFYNDFKRKKLPRSINVILKNLVIELYKTITKMPMKYIGKSVVKEEYSIFKVEKKRSKLNSEEVISTQLLIDKFGSFSIPNEFYLVLKYLGSFIGGSNDIINKWADFTIKANKNQPLDKEFVLKKLYTNPESFRDVQDVKKFYSNQENLFCVWSGKRITQKTINIDHLLPFAHYLNNDIWNLLPTLNYVNNNKRDMVPTPELIHKCSERILNYWGLSQRHFHNVFNEEVRVSLFPEMYQNDISIWGKPAIGALQEKAIFLIEVRGLEPWEKY